MKIPARQFLTSRPSTHVRGRVDRYPLTAVQARLRGVAALQKLAGNQGALRKLASTGAPGQPLAGATRAAMEASFGRTFSDVRLHTGPEVDKAGDALRASAFTKASDIYLHSKAPALATPAGRAVLGEELAHVAQGVGTASVERVTSPSEPLEQEAKQAGSAAAAGQVVNIAPSARASAAVARQEATAAAGTETISPEAVALLNGVTDSLGTAYARLSEEPPDLLGAWARLEAPRDPGYVIGSMLRSQFPSKYSDAFEGAAIEANKGWNVLDAIARPAWLGGTSPLQVMLRNLGDAHQRLAPIAERFTPDVITGGTGDDNERQSGT